MNKKAYNFILKMFMAEIFVTVVGILKLKSFTVLTGTDINNLSITWEFDNSDHYENLPMQ